MKKSLNKKRCNWCLSDDIYIKYHDREWGVPVTDDKKWFEFIILDGAQAGLSWLTVLRKRENYRKAFNGFDVKKIARYDDKKKKELLDNPGIIRNRLKIDSTVRNAKAFIDIQKEFGTFNNYIWQFTGGKTITRRVKGMKDIPPRTDISDAMSKDLKKRGFNFVGSTICYAFMQAAGMVNDHFEDCFRYKEILKISSKSKILKK